MSGKRKRLYYKLTPVFEPLPGDMAVASAAVVTCIATGQILDGMGGGSDALSPEIVDQLDMRKTGGTSRVICDGETFDEMVEALRMADGLLAVYAGSGWPEWGEAKAIRSALAKATGGEE